MSNLLQLNEERPVSPEYDNIAVGSDPQLELRVKRGANWFYWVVGLSVVNSLAFVAGAKIQFLGGLGVTELADAVIDVTVRQGAPGGLRAVSVVFDLVAVVGFALAGYFANKLSRTAFLIGIVVYAIDTVIVLLLGDWFMTAFHVFALYQLIRGFLACRELKAIMKAAVPAAPSSGPAPPAPPTFGQV